MSTIDHVTFRVADVAAGLKLYTRVFELLAFAGDRFDGHGFHEWNDFSIAEADGERPPTSGIHIAFAAAGRNQINTWWQTLTEEGYRDDGAPGLRPEYGPDYYGAFIRDAQSNSVEAVRHRTTSTTPGLIDHLWIRVGDLGAAKRFYTAIAPALGLRINSRGERLQLVAEGGTFTFLEGPPAQHLHLAIGVADEAIVGDFYGAGVAAGGIDNGAPGLRPQYHAGYYAAYLLDPAGHNLEAVYHDRPR